MMEKSLEVVLKAKNKALKTEKDRDASVVKLIESTEKTEFEVARSTLQITSLKKIISQILDKNDTLYLQHEEALSMEWKERETLNQKF